MKHIISFLFVVVFLFISCEDNPVTYPILDNQKALTSISGKIASWPTGLTGKVILKGQSYFVDTISVASIDSNGNFKFSNFKEIDYNNRLNPAYPQFARDSEYNKNSLVCSDSSAGYMESYIFAYYGNDDNLWNQLICKNFIHYYWPDRVFYPGDTYVEFVYVDKDVSLNGDVENHYSYDLKKWITKRHYNLNLVKGWNYQVTKVIKYERFYSNDTLVMDEEVEIKSSFNDSFFWDKY